MKEQNTQEKPCICPKGGIYSDGSICEKCDGTQYDNKTESWEDKLKKELDDFPIPLPNFTKRLINLISQIRQEAVQETLEEIEKEIHKIEIDFIWDNGECSFCGYDSLSNEIHTCGRINETIDRVLDIIRDKKK